MSHWLTKDDESHHYQHSWWFNVINYEKVVEWYKYLPA